MKHKVKFTRREPEVTLTRKSARKRLPLIIAASDSIPDPIDFRRPVEERIQRKLKNPKKKKGKGSLRWVVFHDGASPTQYYVTPAGWRRAPYFLSKYDAEVLFQKLNQIYYSTFKIEKTNGQTH